MSDAHESSGNLPDEMAEYLQTFLDETEEQLDDLVETMLALEKDPTRQDDLNEAFRLIHSIKGSAGMMGFESISEVAHQLENRFEHFHSGTAQLDEPTMNVVLRCLDFFRQSNKRLREGAPLEEPGDLIRALQDLGEQRPSEQRPSEQRPSELAGDESVNDRDADRGDTRHRETLDSPESMRNAGEPPVVRIEVQFRAGLQLADLKAQLILRRLSGLGEIRSTDPDVAQLAESEHPSNFVIELATQKVQEELRAAANVDGVESIMFAGTAASDAPVQESTPDTDADDATLQDTGAPDAPETPSTHLQSSDRSSIDTESTDSNATKTQRVPPPSAETQVIETQRAVDPIGGKPSASARSVEPTSPTDERSVAKVGQSMRVDIDRLDNLMNLAGELIVNRARFVQLSGQISPALRKASMSNRLRDFSENLRRTLEYLQDNEAIHDRVAQVQQLRTGLELVDEQIDVLENGRRYLGQIDEAIDQLSRVSNSLQRGVLETRMVPIGPLFNRFRRVVRDLSKEHGKQVELQIRGERTELDKRMIDDLFDPLLHLVRNAVDHGLEPTGERAELGKPEAGTIALEASHSGNNVYVHVRDDGRGISADKIRARLVGKRMLSESAARELTDEQALEYIWHPGFSTSATVTDVSGRGVGMDVVKTRINSLNGSIDVESTPKRGTNFTLRLPLTLAIINSLLVRLRDATFSMPIADVREIVLVSDEDVVRVSGKQAFESRGEFIPLVRIQDIFHWHGIDYGRALPELSATLIGTQQAQVVILQAGGRTVGLQVDELLGSQDIVVKSLSDNFVDIRGLSGASILGDGSVCLMLDVDALIDMAAGATVAQHMEEAIS